MVTTQGKIPLIFSRQLWKLEIINISCGLVACFRDIGKKIPKVAPARRNLYQASGTLYLYRRFMTNSFGSVISSIA
jgi:hypothetical protein